MRSAAASLSMPPSRRHHASKTFCRDPLASPASLPAPGKYELGRPVSPKCTPKGGRSCSASTQSSAATTPPHHYNHSQNKMLVSSAAASGYICCLLQKALIAWQPCLKVNTILVKTVTTRCRRTLSIKSPEKLLVPELLRPTDAHKFFVGIAVDAVVASLRLLLALRITSLFCCES